MEVGTSQGATALSASYLNRGVRELHDERPVERAISGGDFAYEPVVAWRVNAGKGGAGHGIARPQPRTGRYR